MENVASNNAQAVIKYCPVFTGKSKDGSSEYIRKVLICLSLNSKPVFEVFQGAEQPLPTVQEMKSRQSTLLLSGNGSRRTKIYEASYSSLHLVQQTTSSRDSKASNQRTESGTGRRLWRL